MQLFTLATVFLATGLSAKASHAMPLAAVSAVADPVTGNGGVIQADGSQCGDPNGTVDPTQTGGPNGDENWLNCGVDGNGGWVPPPITLDNVVYQDLATVLQQDGNFFAPCSQYLSIFETASDDTGVPTIFLASIALLESGCQASATGVNGEIGIMQITPDQCPTDGSDCYDPTTNIQIGSQYFKGRLDANNGNLAATLGGYYGWFQGLTIASANNFPTCAQRVDLDYLQKVFNGFLQGVDPASLNMGIYFNTQC